MLALYFYLHFCISAPECRKIYFCNDATVIQYLQVYSRRVKYLGAPPETTSSEEHKEHKQFAVLPKTDGHSLSKQKTGRGA